MATACDLMHLNGLIRMAINLIKGVEIHIRQPPTAPLGNAASTATHTPSSGASAAGSDGLSQVVEGGGAVTAVAGLAAGSVTAAGEASSGPLVFEMAVFSVVSWFKVRPAASI